VSGFSWDEVEALIPPGSIFGQAKIFVCQNQLRVTWKISVKRACDCGDCSDSLAEMLGDLFLPRDMPEAPKQSFFKNLFNISSEVLDREQLCKQRTRSLSSLYAELVKRVTDGVEYCRIEWMTKLTEPRVAVH